MDRGLTGYWCVAGALLVAIFAVLTVVIVKTEPKCPPGSKSTYSRGWYCVVPELK